MTSSTRFIRDHSQVLEAIPTGRDPVLTPFEGIRCVAFDIYGTLFISGSGDIGVGNVTQKEAALRSLLADLDFPPIPESRSITSRFIELIRRSHAASRTKGHEFPEVEVREIWSDLLAEAMTATSVAREQVEALAIAYELATNPVWPMPGLAGVLGGLRDRGLLLGIVSNAQFYTPLLFDAFLDRNLDQLGFHPALRVFSYQHKRAKPGAFLYGQLRDALATQGISPGETLYVGNDALKDVHPAATLGFRTVLFSGDRRSLRLRKDRPDLLPPDAEVTHLAQIPKLLQ
jgi:putative hydrolase of the HAD superfamily